MLISLFPAIDSLTEKFKKHEAYKSSSPNEGNLREKHNNLMGGVIETYDRDDGHLLPDHSLL